MYQRTKISALHTHTQVAISSPLASLTISSSECSTNFIGVLWNCKYIHVFQLVQGTVCIWCNIHVIIWRSRSSLDVSSGKKRLKSPFAPIGVYYYVYNHTHIHAHNHTHTHTHTNTHTHTQPHLQLPVSPSLWNDLLSPLGSEGGGRQPREACCYGNTIVESSVVRWMTVP